VSEKIRERKVEGEAFSRSRTRSGLLGIGCPQSRPHHFQKPQRPGGLNAIETKFFQKDGTVTDQREMIAGPNAGKCSN
jgi:hypothetical protein